MVQRPNAAPRAARPAARHGVLFVHGVGDQRQSDALLWFGRPLIDWLEDWHRARGEPVPIVEAATLGFSPFDPGEPGFLPRARVRFRHAGHSEDTWVLAETWWAASSLRPEFSAMVQRSSGYLRVALAQLRRTAHLRWERLRTASSPDSTDPSAFLQFIDWLNTLGMLIVYAIAGWAGLIVIVAPLIILSRIPLPPVQDFILLRLLRPFLLINIGEFTTFMEDEIQAANMRRRIADGIHWLLASEGGDCDDVTIIAYSGGALLAFGALTDPAQERPDDGLGQIAGVRKLITLGSGLNKGWLVYPDLERMRRPLPPHIHWLDIWTAYDPVPAGPVMPPADGRGGRIPIFQPDERLVARQGLTPTLPRVLPSHQETQQARQAAGLPEVTVGVAPEAQYWPVSEEVTNRMLLLVDHGRYLENAEQVLVRLAAEIDHETYWCSAYWTGSEHGQAVNPRTRRTDTLKETVAARRVRVSLLATWRLVAIAAAALLALLGLVSGWSWPSGTLGRAVTDFLLTTELIKPLSKPLNDVTNFLTSLLQPLGPMVTGVLDVIRAIPVLLISTALLVLLLLIVYASITTFVLRWDDRDRRAGRLATGKVALARHPRREQAVQRWAQVVQYRRD